MSGEESAKEVRPLINERRITREQGRGREGRRVQRKAMVFETSSPFDPTPHPYSLFAIQTGIGWLMHDAKMTLQSSRVDLGRCIGCV